MLEQLGLPVGFARYIVGDLLSTDTIFSAPKRLAVL